MGLIKMANGEYKDLFIASNYYNSEKNKEFLKNIRVDSSQFSSYTHSISATLDGLINNSKLSTNVIDMELNKYTNRLYILQNGYMAGTGPYSNDYVEYYTNHDKFNTNGTVGDLIIHPHRSKDYNRSYATLGYNTESGYVGSVIFRLLKQNGVSNSEYIDSSLSLEPLLAFGVQYPKPSFIPREWKYLVIEFLQGELPSTISLSSGYSHYCGDIRPIEAHVVPKTKIYTFPLDSNFEETAPNKKIILDNRHIAYRKPYKLVLELQSDSNVESCIQIAYGYYRTSTMPTQFQIHTRIKDAYLLK